MLVFWEQSFSEMRRALFIKRVSIIRLQFLFVFMSRTSQKRLERTSSPLQLTKRSSRSETRSRWQTSSLEERTSWPRFARRFAMKKPRRRRDTSPSRRKRSSVTSLTLICCGKSTLLFTAWWEVVCLFVIVFFMFSFVPKVSFKRVKSLLVCFGAIKNFVCLKWVNCLHNSLFIFIKIWPFNRLYHARNNDTRKIEKLGTFLQIKKKWDRTIKNSLFPTFILFITPRVVFTAATMRMKCMVVGLFLIVLVALCILQKSASSIFDVFCSFHALFHRYSL